MEKGQREGGRGKGKGKGEGRGKGEGEGGRGRDKGGTREEKKNTSPMAITCSTTCALFLALFGVKIWSISQYDMLFVVCIKNFKFGAHVASFLVHASRKNSSSVIFLGSEKSRGGGWKEGGGRREEGGGRREEEGGRCNVRNISLI
jgi:hypothetical protein